MLEWNVADPDPDRIRMISGSRIRIRIRGESRIRIHQSQYSGAVDAQNGAMENHRRSQWRRGGSKWSREGSVDQWSQIHMDEVQSRPEVGSKPDQSEKFGPDPHLSDADPQSCSYG